MDADDTPLQFFPQLRRKPQYFKDYTKFSSDLTGGTLPSFSYIKFAGYHNEHPGYGTTISDGAALVKNLIDSVAASPTYKDNTLIFWTYDECGGFFDHVSPPADSLVDLQPYGPRIPMMAIGALAKKNHISHTRMEHASLIRFVEWNWLNSTGQLEVRDADPLVQDVSDMLDSSLIGSLP